MGLESSKSTPALQGMKVEYNLCVSVSMCQRMTVRSVSPLRVINYRFRRKLSCHNVIVIFGAHTTTK